jgi:hypothetical protein
MRRRPRIYPGMWFRYCLATFLLICLLPEPARVQAPTATVTTVEHSEPWPRPKPGTLGTMGYPPTPIEKPFFDKLSPKERVTGSMLGKKYSIKRKTGKYISWCGIVRRIDEDSAAGRTKLLVEMKYFDGMTDTHIMALSFNGIPASPDLGVRNIVYIHRANFLGMVSKRRESIACGAGPAAFIAPLRVHPLAPL